MEYTEVFQAPELEQAKARLKPYEAGMPYHEPRPQPGPSSRDSPRSR